jgi:hypothetical protein
VSDYDRRAMEHEDHTTWPDASPLGGSSERVTEALALAEGPVRFLLVSGPLDDTRWGLVGAYWMSIDGCRGGFLVAPKAVWTGSEIARSYRSAQRRGWNPEQIYLFWQERVGICGRLMIDPQQHADTLFHVARRVGAL